MKRFAVGVAALALTAACSTGVAGEPVAELWDPCTIPAEALQAAGVDPEIRGNRGENQPDTVWKFCIFRQDWYFLTIYSTTLTLDDLRSRSTVISSSDLTIEGAPAITYRGQLPDEPASCFTSIATEFGTVEFEVSHDTVRELSGDVCAISTDIAMTLAVQIPR